MAVGLSTDRSDSVEKRLRCLRLHTENAVSIDLYFKSTIFLLHLCSLQTNIEAHPFTLSSHQRPAAART